MARRDPVWVDADPTTHLPSYSALELRGLLNGFQAGVVGAGDFKVTAGSGLSVDSAAGRATVAPTGVFPGLYYCADDAAQNSAAFESGPIPANATSNPRLDAVVVHVFDHGLDGSGRREWVRQYVPGVAAPGAALGGTLPTLPSSSLPIAEVLVPAGNPTSIPSANIRDRRGWAKGAYRPIARSQNAAGSPHYGISVTANALIDPTNLYPRVECSGAPMRLRIAGGTNAITGVAVALFLVPWVDGVAVDGFSDGFMHQFPDVNVRSFSFVREFVPTPGSHRVGWAARVNTGSVQLIASATMALDMSVEEIVKPNAENT